MFLSACGGAAAPAEAPVTDEGQQQEAAVSSEDTAVPSTESAADETAAEGTDEVGKIYYDPDLVPSVPDYKVEDDFSNVKYHKNFGYLFDPAYDNECTDTSLLRNALI